jgi:transcriptional regulator GlxA family with amidase domain
LTAQLQMEARFSKSLQIDTLAGEAGLSPRHFKRFTGLAPREYRDKFSQL